jgi:hypothetical protein
MFVEPPWGFGLTNVISDGSMLVYLAAPPQAFSYQLSAISYCSRMESPRAATNLEYKTRAAGSQGLN